VSSTSTHDHYAVAFPSSLRSPRVPISAQSKELVIIVKGKPHKKTDISKRVS